MNLVFFTHPDFLGHQSMPRFANMLAAGLTARGHMVKIWNPAPVFVRLPAPRFLKKWLGYIDQYIVFPTRVRRKIKSTPKDTLFVFTDHALGPWVPIVKDLHHVIHCHDFLAQWSALGVIPENPTSWTGRLYQSYIGRGYSRGKNFISVSEKTRNDLHQFLSRKPLVSEVVYNGLNQSFNRIDRITARNIFGERIKMDLSSGYILHVGGNAWYKNRRGVIEIYDAWRTAGGQKLPLLLVGETPSQDLVNKYSQSPFQSDIHCLPGIEDRFVQHAYAGASVFLFPSLAEGFGWPIAEAMAAGCPVITTDERPMTEVAGTAAYLIPRMPNSLSEVQRWSETCAAVLREAVALQGEALNERVQAGIANARRFDTDVALNHIEDIYRNILNETK